MNDNSNSLDKKKYFIIGQGLAGSVLALLMIDAEMDVTVLDDGHLSSSSMVAAGMWNPVTFKKLNESWLASQVVPMADNIYSRLEEKFNTSFYHPTELVRIFADAHTSNDWDERSVHPELSSFLSDDQDEVVAQQIHQPYGHGVVHHAGWMDVPGFVQCVKSFLLEQKKLIVEKVTEERILALSADENCIIIYCTGWKSLVQYGFDWLPMIPNKGEVLTIKSENLQVKRMMNFGKFLIPLGNNLFRLGATYELSQTDLRPTDAGKSELLNQLCDVYPEPVDVMHHQVGYRPTMPDRRPVLGFHPENPKYAIFNGFGSKGVMLIPFFADHFIQVLQGENVLMKDVDVKRYWNKVIPSVLPLIAGFKEKHNAADGGF